MTYDVACPVCGRIDRSLYPELPEPKKRKKSKPEMERESLL